MISSLSGGSDGDARTTTVTNDLWTKIGLYVKVEKILRILAYPGNDAAKEQACANLKAALASSPMMAEDAFSKAWADYGSSEMTEMLDHVVKNFREFRNYAKLSLTTRASEFNVRDVEKLREQVDGVRKYAYRITPYWTRQDDMSRSYSPHSEDSETKASRIAWEELESRIPGIGIELRKLLKFIGEDEQIAAKTKEVNELVGKVSSTRQYKQTVNVATVKDRISVLSDEISGYVERASEKLSSPSAGTFDPRKSGFEDFLTYSMDGDNDDLRKHTSDVLLPQNEAKLFKDRVSLTYFNNRVGSALVGKLFDMRARTTAFLRKVPADNRNPDLSSRKQLVQAMDGLLQLAGTKLQVVDPNGPPSELRQVQDRLLDSKLAETLDAGNQIKTISPSQGADGRYYASAQQQSSSSSSQGGVPGIGFLYRTIDASRAFKYLEQIETFRDDAIASRVVDFVDSQAKRLAETVQDLERQAKSVNDRGIDDAGDGGGGGATGATSAGELALRLRQLALSKVAAVKSFVRGVKSSVAMYASMHLRFVSERHGEATRYMRYWDDLVSTTKGDAARLEALGVDDACKTAIEDHKKALAALSETARTTLGEVRGKVLAAHRDSLGSSGHPRLDDDQQAEVDRAIDALSAWVLDRAERIEDTYLRGAPTMLESVLEPMTLMLYGLKAVRLMCAAAALNVACGTFENLYFRRVYTLDAPPPNPAILVALALGLDAALSAIVLLVLYTTMRVFKTADNDFPIDPELLWTWLHDYVAATLAVGALSLIVCEVVRSKKYFRYKYVGDRGIRAMREMMWYVYCVLLPIPFYRLLG